jgi:hypothetical protein
MNGARRRFGQFVIEIVRSMAGPSFSAAESVFIVLACIGAGVAFACYSELAGWRWSLVQQIVAGFLVFDLVGGAIAYNSAPSKMDRFDRSNFMDYLPHQSVHIHPIIAAFFYTQWLPWVFGYYLVLFVLFIVFFEPKPAVGQTAVNAITVLVLALSLALIVALFVVEEAWGLYGGTTYLSLLLFSIVVFLVPVRSQSMVAASLVVLMCLLNGTVIAAPPGFTWLIPVFFLKLTLGYVARSSIASAVSPSA